MCGDSNDEPDQTMKLTEDAAWYMLATMRGVGARTLWSLAAYLKDRNEHASWLIEHPEDIPTQLASRIKINHEGHHRYWDEMEELFHSDVSVIHPFSKNFPQRLWMSSEAASVHL